MIYNLMIYNLVYYVKQWLSEIELQNITILGNWVFADVINDKLR